MTATIDDRKRRLLFLVLVIAFLLPLPAVFAAIHPETQFDIDSKAIKEVLNHQIEMIRTDDIPSAYYTDTSLEFRKATSLADFIKLINSVPVLAKNQSFDVYQITFQKNMAVCEGTLSATDGSKLDVVYELVLEEGDWKIQGIQLFKPQTRV